MKDETIRGLKVLQEMHQKREEQKLNLSNLKNTVDMLEQNRLRISKSYDAAMQERNKR